MCQLDARDSPRGFPAKSTDRPLRPPELLFLTGTFRQPRRPWDGLPTAARACAQTERTRVRYRLRRFGLGDRHDVDGQAPRRRRHYANHQLGAAGSTAAVAAGLQDDTM